MQTFLPYPDVIRSAQCLDWRRLGKQRVEAFQILKVLRGESEGWKNHPAVRMWRGYEPFLQDYMNQMIVEWIRRGYRNTMKIEFVWPQPLYPHWWGSEEFHASHRSNLLRKDPVHYGQFGWPEDRSLPYVWPV